MDGPESFHPDKKAVIALNIELEIYYREGQDMQEVADSVHRQLKNSFFRMTDGSECLVKWEARSKSVTVDLDAVCQHCGEPMTIEDHERNQCPRCRK